ncbi:MAG: sporulation protein YunB [Pelotomaculum sp.]
MLFKKRRRVPLILGLGLACIVLVSLLIAIDVFLRGTFYRIAEYKSVQVATNAIQEVLKEQTSMQNIRYQDFVIIHTDNEGHITLMQADTVKVNNFAATTTLAVEKALEELKWQNFTIPLGQIFNRPILAHLGPRITYRFMPVGVVRVDVLDKFEAAGINQTRHSIYLTFDTELRIVIPAKSGETQVSAKVPVVESIIVGDVPSTFVNVNGGLLGRGLFK